MKGSELNEVIISEWLGDTGGGEQVLLAAAVCLPEAKIRAYAATENWYQTFDAGRFSTILGKNGGDSRVLRISAPVMPAIWRMSGIKAQRALILHHAFATSAAGRNIDVAVSYVHTPARYLWDPELDPRGRGLAASIARPALKRVDKAAAQRIADIACNSEETRRRIQKHWGRDAQVIHPFVRTELFTPRNDGHPRASHLPAEYVLSYGRWISYKRFKESIDFAAAAECTLVICGGGPEEGELRRYANSMTQPGQVTFIKDPSTSELVEIVRGARALLFPGIEDFGIVPLEAQSAGVPVIARAAGGALETVIHEKTGFLIDSDDPSTWAVAIDRVDELDRNACRANALLFSEQRFVGELSEWLRNWGFNAQ